MRSVSLKNTKQLQKRKRELIRLLQRAATCDASRMLSMNQIMALVEDVDSEFALLRKLASVTLCFYLDSLRGHGSSLSDSIKSIGLEIFDCNKVLINEARQKDYSFRNALIYVKNLHKKVDEAVFYAKLFDEDPEKDSESTASDDKTGGSQQSSSIENQGKRANRGKSGYSGEGMKVVGTGGKGGKKVKAWLTDPNQGKSKDGINTFSSDRIIQILLDQNFRELPDPKYWFIYVYRKRIQIWNLVWTVDSSNGKKPLKIKIDLKNSINRINRHILIFFWTHESPKISKK